MAAKEKIVQIDAASQTTAVGLSNYGRIFDLKRIGRSWRWVVRSTEPLPELPEELTGVRKKK